MDCNVDHGRNNMVRIFTQRFYRNSQIVQN